MNLTPRQRDLMRFIQRYVDANGCSPSLDEARVALGLGSKATIFRALDNLEGRGFISRMEYRQRSIAILKRVPDPQAAPDTAFRAFVEEVAAAERPVGVELRDKAKRLLERYA